MTRVLIFLLLLSFILWILPLGYFIKPCQQKLACDGERAMCMCHVMMVKSPDKAMEHGVGIKEGASTNKEGSSGSAGNYFFSPRNIVSLNLHSSSFFENPFLTYQNPFLAAIEYVPKF